MWDAVLEDAPIVPQRHQPDATRRTPGEGPTRSGRLRHASFRASERRDRGRIGTLVGIGEGSEIGVP